MKTHRCKRSACVALLALMAPAHAAYNANITGRVIWVSSYTDADYLIFQLENQPTTHPACNPAFFVIAQDVLENRRNQAFAQLMASRYSGEAINIGYDAQGECANGYIRVHRVG